MMKRPQNTNMELSQFSGNRSACIRITSLNFFFLSNHANKMAFGNQLKNLESLLCACQAQLHLSHASLYMRLEESLGRKMDYSKHWRKQ